MLETELKCMLTEEEYDRLKTMFRWDWVKEQVNSYYSDPSLLLKKHGITLRVRTKDGISKIQVKAHKNAGSPLQICEESEYGINCVPDSFTADEVEKMTGLRTEASLLGSLTTLRHSLMYCGGVELCLDKNDYLDRTDYELELEYTKDIPDTLKNALADAGIGFSAPAVGKCTRFMQRLGELIRGAE